MTDAHKVTDGKLNDLRTMTIGELLDMLNTSGATDIDAWTKIKTILAHILWDAEDFYDNRADCAEDEVLIAALRIAAYALAENGTDRNTATNMAREMAST